LTVQPAIMSGFYRFPPEVSKLARDVANLNACFAAMGGGPSPVAHQFAAAMPQQKDAVAAASQALAASKAKGGKRAKGGKGGERAKGGKSGKSATPQVMVACRYGTRCTSRGCAFQHPKGFLPVCTMGPACLGPKVCPYRHTKPTAPPKAQSPKAPPKVPKQSPKAQPPKAQSPKAPPKVPKQSPKAPPKVPKQSPKAQPPQCHYLDACHRSGCYFFHPGGDKRIGLMCRHGAACHSKKSGKCPFKHP